MLIGSLMARSVGILAQVALLMVSARVSSSDAIGAFSLYATWLLFATALIDCGAAQYVLREGAALLKAGRDPTAAILGAMALTGMVWFATVVLSELAVRTFLAGRWEQYVDIARWSIWSALPATWLSILGQTLRSYSRPAASMLLLFAVAPLASMLIIVVCLWCGLEIGWGVLAGANLAGLCAAMFIALGLCLRARPQPGGTLRVHWPRLGALSSQYYASVLTIIFVALPSFLLPALVSVGEIGLFYVALRITTLLASLLDAVAGIYAPRVAAHFSVGDMDGVRAEFSRSLVITRAFALVLGLGLTTLAPWLLAVFGAPYADGAGLLRLQMLGRVVQLSTGITSSVLWMIERPLLEGSLSVLAALLTVACSWLSYASPAVVVSVAVSLGHAFKNGAQYLILMRIFRAAAAPLPP